MPLLLSPLLRPALCRPGALKPIRLFPNSSNCPRISLHHRNAQQGRPGSLASLRATARDALSELGLSAEQHAAVEEVVRATSADSDLVQSVSTLVFYAGSVSAARALVVRHPSLLCCQLPSWTEFLTAFGLNKAQVQHVLCQTPEALLQGDLVKAGESILAFRRLGMDERAASQLVTYYPQLLGKSDEDIRATVNLLGRFQQGVESSSC
ncbi:hypothetical protein CHLRE_01g038300v5 [Chlamydomonas reinhardtii]|uniref:Uncharacterized protein n=1 Tax=Chlamydomonas reinhardtii TaxID=3055 RepID=A8HMB7_CHLRE|nr:uncharacterized protein CHLRE_01g038300v5 [Chlamydomonas reinhardtii]PNW88640.1 hypothetical protein CHLRE_01g038300v5 [Chlamydomonas reinhardtii]|eukprot:XP_001690121.1 predicted protein [Chlamydomonas reinhardtii]